MVPSCVVLTAALMPGEQAYCTRIFLVYTVRQVASACRTVSADFTYFPSKYVKSHFSDRVNGLSKAHYFFTEVDQMTKHIVTREIRDNKNRELARVFLSRAVTTRGMPGDLAPARSSWRRCSSNSASMRHLTFATMNLLITDVGTAGHDTSTQTSLISRWATLYSNPTLAILEKWGTTLSLVVLLRSLEVYQRPPPMGAYLASFEAYSFPSSTGSSTSGTGGTGFTLLLWLVAETARLAFAFLPDASLRASPLARLGCLSLSPTVCIAGKPTPGTF